MHLTPEMMHHVEVADLGEEAAYRLTVVLAIADGSGPAEMNRLHHRPNQLFPLRSICYYWRPQRIKVSLCEIEPLPESRWKTVRLNQTE